MTKLVKKVVEYSIYATVKLLTHMQYSNMQIFDECNIRKLQFAYSIVQQCIRKLDSL